MEGLKEKEDQTHQELRLCLPNTVLEEVLLFGEKAQLSQHSEGKERQTRKLYKQGSITHADRHGEIRTTHSQDIWFKNLSDRTLNQSEVSVLAKGINFAIKLEQIPVVDVITVTEETIRDNKLAEAEKTQTEGNSCPFQFKDTSS